MNESEPTTRDRNRDRQNSAKTDGGAASARDAMSDAGPTSDVPDEAIASVDDFAHERDERGDILPVAEPVPGTSRPCAACEGSGRVLVAVGTPDGDETDDPDESADGDDADNFKPCPECGGAGETPKYVVVRPITQGEANRLLPDDGNISDLDDRRQFKIIREFVERPDFSGVESLDDFGAFSLDPLLMAVMNASGFDMASGMVTENSEFMNAIEGNSQSGN